MEPSEGKKTLRRIVIELGEVLAALEAQLINNPNNIDERVSLEHIEKISFFEDELAPLGRWQFLAIMPLMASQTLMSPLVI
jgi:hypothetical protein